MFWDCFTALRTDLNKICTHCIYISKYAKIDKLFLNHNGIMNSIMNDYKA